VMGGETGRILRRYGGYLQVSHPDEKILTIRGEVGTIIF